MRVAAQIEHPGVILREEMEARQMNITRLSQLLGIGRPSLSSTLNGHYAITPFLAIMLESHGFPSAEYWLTLQMQYDLHQERIRIAKGKEKQ